MGKIKATHTKFKISGDMKSFRVLSELKSLAEFKHFVNRVFRDIYVRIRRSETGIFTCRGEHFCNYSG